MRRTKAGRADTIIYGIHAVEHFLKRYPERVLQIMAAGDRQDRRLSSITDEAKRMGLVPQTVSRETLDRHSGNGAHQGVLAVIRPRPPGNEDDLEVLLDQLSEPPFLLVLDGLQDPHNLGACMRTADATGVHAVIAPRNRAVGLSPAVRKVASGASESVPFIQVTNLARTLRRLAERGLMRVGAEGEAATSLFDADLSGGLAVVLGAEGGGLRRLTREHCDLLVSLPMRGVVESLNVSVATGVFLYTALAQRSLSRLASGEGFD